MDLEKEYVRLKEIWEENKNKIQQLEKDKFGARTELDMEKKWNDKMLGYYKQLFLFIEKNPSLENTFNNLVEKSKLIEVIELEDIKNDE